MGYASRSKVICQNTHRGVSHKVAEDGNQESVPVIEGVSASGILLPPLVMEKGNDKNMGWYEEVNGDRVNFANLHRGKLIDLLGLQWLEKIFLPLRSQNLRY